VDEPSSSTLDLAPRQDRWSTLGSRRLLDPYRYLERSEDTRTKRWQIEQHGRWQACVRQLELADFRNRVADLTAYDDYSLPQTRPGGLFVAVRTADAEHTVLYRIDSSGRREPLLDPKELGSTGRANLDSWSASPDGRHVAFLVCTAGSELGDIGVLDCRTGAVCEAAIASGRHSPLVWRRDGRSFYYVTPRQGQQVVMHHRLDTSAIQDPCVHVARGGTTHVLLHNDPRDRWLVVTEHHGPSRTRLWAALAEPNHPPMRMSAVDLDGEGWSDVCGLMEDQAFLITDDRAPYGKLVRVDLRSGQAITLLRGAAHRVLVGAVILGSQPGRSSLLVAVWDDHTAGEQSITVHAPTGGHPAARIPLFPHATVLDIGSEAHTNAVWFKASSPLAPPTLHRWTEGGSISQLGNTMGVSGIEYQATRYRARDGTAVDLHTLRPKGGHRDARSTLLHGYGAFGISSGTDYYAVGLAWAAAGGIFATAAVRGGGEHGEDWHIAGRGMKKITSVNDFVDAAEHLTRTETSPGRLAAFGESAGGLLVTAAACLRPQSFSAVVALSPLSDMARYHRSGMGENWLDEFGSPEQPDQGDALAQYSPYHNVTPGSAHPAALLISFLEDSRVPPFHARKLCAALQYASPTGTTLLHEHDDLGHADKVRSTRLDIYAEILAFAAHHTGLRK
jgi:prolyl oligopeptidase